MKFKTSLRIVSALLVAVSTLAGLPAASAAPERKPIKGSFEASGVPVVPYFATDDCLPDYQANSHTFEVPAAGRLDVKMDQFQGDWDIWVDTETEPYAAGAYDSQNVGQEGTEEFSFIVTKPTRLRIVACSFSGGPTAHVEYVYRFGEFSTLLDGPDALLKERLPVNFVFVGFDRETVEARFREELPKRYRPVVRSRSWDAMNREVLPIEHVFDYKLTFTEKSWEERFFAWLKGKADDRGVSATQSSYNASGSNRITIDNNAIIPAFETEQWLANNPPPGVDTSEYTAYFIDWYGKKGFTHHLYAKAGEPDTDSKVDYGATPNQMMVAWGGTPVTDQETRPDSVSRVWFYDMSAGPDWRTGNWDVSEDAAGYRILPSWEYHEDGARSPKTLGTDLGRLARFVAIDLLFTPSPLYPPSITPPKLPDSIALEMDQYSDKLRPDPALDKKEVLQEVSELIPTTKFSTTETQTLPFATSDAGRCFGTYFAAINALMQGAWPAVTAPSCYPERENYYVLSNLFLHNAMSVEETRDDVRADYNAQGFLYAYPGGLYPAFSGLADDNSKDGTQSFIYVVSTSLGGSLPGVTDTTIHEYGHHFGVSHPHDGYDFEKAKGFGPYGKTYFAWTGDESNTVMSYLSVNNDFSQFDRDSMDRWLAGSYLQHARGIARKISDGSGWSAAALDEVDAATQAAVAAFARHDWSASLRSAKRAYELTLEEAHRAGIKVKGSEAGWTLAEEDSAARSRKALPKSAYIDFIDENRPWFDPELAGR